jgi:hypothetical protein
MKIRYCIFTCSIVCCIIIEVVSAAEDSLICQVDLDCDALKVGFICVDVPADMDESVAIFDKQGLDVTNDAKKYCIHK